MMTQFETRSGTSRMLFALAGGAAVGWLVARAGPPSRPRASRRQAPRKVVVVGAGFGGLAVASRLAGRAGIDLTVIDAHDSHLFQPLLYQVATAALSPADIASPVRGILPASPGVRVLTASVTGVDTGGRRVLCDGCSVPYDELVIATGSCPSYFGHDDWAAAAPGLKTMDDALGLRRQLLAAFERASAADPAGGHASPPTFVLIGGGATGVEMAGSIAELARDVQARGPGLSQVRARILLIEAGPRILSAFTPDLSDYAAAVLRNLGVEIMTGTKVTQIAPGLVHLGDRTIPAASVIWAAGNQATPVAEWLGVAPAHGGRVAVGPDLRVAGHPRIAVIGDAALALGGDGKPLPALAPVAKQQGRFVAGAILRRRRGRHAPAAFAYRDYGTLAAIGRTRAVAEFGSVHVTGLLAWMAWAVAHIFFLIGFRNRVLVSAQWAFSYMVHKREARLLTGCSAGLDT